MNCLQFLYIITKYHRLCFVGVYHQPYLIASLCSEWTQWTFQRAFIFCPHTLTAAWAFLLMSLSNRTNWRSAPYDSSTAQVTVWSMLSNAFWKSTKQLKIFLLFRRAFSAISLKARICCTVLLSFRSSPRQYGQTPQQPRSPRQYGQSLLRQAQQQPRSGLKCFICDRTGHIAKTCCYVPCQRWQDKRNADAEQRAKEENRLCRRKVHALRAQVGERDRKSEETLMKAAAFQPMTRNFTAKLEMLPGTCRQHKRVNCPQCLDIPTPAHHCQVFIAVCQDCKLHHPVVGDACQLQNKIQQMPVVDGTVEGKPVRVMRDTGCSTVVFRRSLIPAERLTGLEERCIYIDGTVRQTPVAKVEVETPYFSGTVLAVCMENSIYDLIIAKHSWCHRSTV